MSFLVDAEGRVRSWVFGECDWSEGELAAALERLLGEAERAARAAPAWWPASTRAMTAPGSRRVGR
jgi:hypothetical protein